MSEFLKAIACIVVAVILVLVLDKQGKYFSILLVLFVCCTVILLTTTYFLPVINFFNKLQTVGNLDQQMLNVVLKAVGIGLLAELVGQICADSGNASMGKALQMLAAAVILWLMIPLFTQLIELVETILGSI